MDDDGPLDPPFWYRQNESTATHKDVVVWLNPCALIRARHECTILRRDLHSLRASTEEMQQQMDDDMNRVLDSLRKADRLRSSRNTQATTLVQPLRSSPPPSNSFDMMVANRRIENWHIRKHQPLPFIPPHSTTWCMRLPKPISETTPARNM